MSATQSAAYWQWHPWCGGSHVPGSWSDLERLLAAETAISARSSSWSLAYASRSWAVHARAPLSQASASRTRWSASRLRALSKCRSS
ncbi:hypothetical protein [Streptomyces sp. NBC_01314]|uniref:hypothetical protein n=1 Tax=Streptomyces sp. NBC_01314 TaxID=2903821 RepID=UPI00352C3E6D